MPRWTPSDIPWDQFDPDKLQKETLKVLKAAALTEFNAADYARYLGNVFADDSDFCKKVDEWALEEEQHGRMLGRYGELADPSFSFEKVVSRFRDGYRINTNSSESIRGSRTGELISRCIVESGTSSFYSAISDSTDEPVLKVLARRIAVDEFHHYAMFREAMLNYQQNERLSIGHRTLVALGRIREIDDDELAFAYHCANASYQPALIRTDEPTAGIRWK